MVSDTKLVIDWRIKNLINVSNNFQTICDEQNLSDKHKNIISKRLGYEWLEGASLEEDEYLQKMWAELLANEVKDNGSTSLLTINALKNMRKSDALVFQKACNLALEHEGIAFIPTKTYKRMSDLGMNLLDYELKVKDLALLESLGLINVGTSNVVSLEYGDTLSHQGENYKICSIEDKSDDFTGQSVTAIGNALFSHIFTEAGVNLLRIVKQEPAIFTDASGVSHSYLGGYIQHLFSVNNMELEKVKN